MRPIPIPDHLANQPGRSRRVLGAPDGDLTNPAIAPLEVLDHRIALDELRSDDVGAMTTLWKPDPDELERLNAGGVVELTLLGGAHPPVMLYVIHPNFLDPDRLDQP